jgi:hypothetical protein
LKSDAQKFSAKRIATVCGVFAVSAIASYYIGEPLRLSEKPSEYIGLTFSILAASVFAVISIIGDPGMMLPGSWRTGWQSAKAVQIEIQRLNVLFVWYLLTLGLLVTTEIIDSQEWTSLYFLFYIFGFFSVAGFLLSLAIPFELWRIQRRRLEHEIEQRRRSRKPEGGPQKG